MVCGSTGNGHDDTSSIPFTWKGAVEPTAREMITYAALQHMDGAATDVLHTGCSPGWSMANLDVHGVRYRILSGVIAAIRHKYSHPEGEHLFQHTLAILK